MNNLNTQLQIQNFDTVAQANEYLQIHAEQFGVKTGDRVDLCECELHGTFYYSSQAHKYFCEQNDGDSLVATLVIQ